MKEENLAQSENEATQKRVGSVVGNFDDDGYGNPLLHKVMLYNIRCHRKKINKKNRKVKSRWNEKLGNHC